MEGSMSLHPFPPASYILALCLLHLFSTGAPFGLPIFFLSFARFFIDDASFMCIASLNLDVRNNPHPAAAAAAAVSMSAFP
jgi:hypothetical protein